MLEGPSQPGAADDHPNKQFTPHLLIHSWLGILTIAKTILQVKNIDLDSSNKTSSRHKAQIRFNMYMVVCVYTLP